MGLIWQTLLLPQWQPCLSYSLMTIWHCGKVWTLKVSRTDLAISPAEQVALDKIWSCRSFYEKKSYTAPRQSLLHIWNDSVYQASSQWSFNSQMSRRMTNQVFPYPRASQTSVWISPWTMSLNSRFSDPISRNSNSVEQKNEAWESTYITKFQSVYATSA